MMKARTSNFNLEELPRIACPFVVAADVCVPFVEAAVEFGTPLLRDGIEWKPFVMTGLGFGML